MSGERGEGAFLSLPFVGSRRAKLALRVAGRRPVGWGIPGEGLPVAALLPFLIGQIESIQDDFQNTWVATLRKQKTAGGRSSVWRGEGRRHFYGRMPFFCAQAR